MSQMLRALSRLLRSSDAYDDAVQNDAAFDQVRRQVEGVRRTVLFDGTLGLYQRWYFELRLKEEMERCLRYDLSMAVVVVQLADDGKGDAADQDWQAEASEAAYVTARAVRTVDLTATVGAREFAVCLVHCDRDGATVAMQRLAGVLGAHDCSIGTAVFPEDNCEPKQLVELARSRALPAHTLVTA